MKKILFFIVLLLVSFIGMSQVSLYDAYRYRVRTQIDFNASNGTLNRGIRLNNSNFSNDQAWMDFYPSSGLNVSTGSRWVPRGVGKSGNNIAQLDLYGTDFLANQTNYRKMSFVAREDGTFGINLAHGGTYGAPTFVFSIANASKYTVSPTQISFHQPTGYSSPPTYEDLGVNDFLSKSHVNSLGDSIIIQSISTTGAITANLDTIYVPENHAAVVDVTLMVENTANDEVMSGRKTLTIKNINGVYTLVGTVQTLFTDQKQASLSAATWTLDISGGLPVIRITGATSLNINWEATYTKIYKPLN